MSHNSLLDDLLDDLNDSDEELDQSETTTTNLNDLIAQEEQEAAQEEADEDTIMAEGDYLPSGGVKPTQELDSEVVNEMALGEIKDIIKVAKLYGSKIMKEVLTVSTRSHDNSC